MPGAATASDWQRKWCDHDRWRAGVDTHVCPLADGTTPHIGGTVAVGSTTVLIGGAAAARQGDVIVEAGPPNAIAMGAVTVLIG